MDESKRAALLVGGVYFVLYFLSSFASRNSHRISDWRGGDEGAAQVMWWVDLVLFALLIPALWFSWYPAIIALFVALAILQNFWRPGLISRFNAQSTPSMSATILSIEAQSKSLATIILAPLLGLLVDSIGNFSPVGVIGTAIAIAILITYHSELETNQEIIAK